MKFVYCAQCGEKLEVYRKAVPKLQKIFDLIRPHNCGEITLEDVNEEAVEKIVENEVNQTPPSSKLDKMFDSFKFVKKLNDLKPKVSPLEAETGDRRNKDDLRKEITSSAPTNLISSLGNLPNSPTENEPEGE